MPDTEIDASALFNKLTTAEIIRLGYTYAIFIFIEF